LAADEEDAGAGDGAGLAVEDAAQLGVDAEDLLAAAGDGGVDAAAGRRRGSGAGSRW
jgi:hypothetical protein